VRANGISTNPRYAQLYDRSPNADDTHVGHAAAISGSRTMQAAASARLT
jgi:hypothetical protein